MQKLKVLLLSLLVLPALMFVGCDDHTHELTLVGATDATCTTAGNTAYYTCECGHYFSDAEGTQEIAEDSWIVSATGHTDNNDDEMCDTCGNGAEFVVNNVNYATLNDAFANATNNSTITVYEDVALTQCITLNDKAITLDMNGKTITFEADTVGDGIFLVTGDGELTIDGNGTLNSASQANDYSMCLWAKDGGKIIINSGTFTNVGAKDYEDPTPEKPVPSYNNNELIYASADGEIVINGGTFIGNTENSAIGAKFTLNLKDNTNGTITVYGGTFVEFNPAEADTEPTVQSNNGLGTYSFLAEGYTVITSGDIYTVIPASN